MTIKANNERLKVAVIGGGPGGLGIAIELSRLSFVDWELYEKKPLISETGGGLTLQLQKWRLLERNGAAKNISDTDFFQSIERVMEQRRNGRSGELLSQKFNAEDDIPEHDRCRLSRAKLQSALLKEVDQTHIHVNKRLSGVQSLSDQRIRINFEDGLVDDVDLLIAADGIRSSIRSFCFPSHTLSYNGQCVYRTVVSKAEVKKIKGIPWAPVFWKHVSALYVFTCPLGEDDFEVTARIRPTTQGEAEPVSWGHPVDFRTLLPEYSDFCLPVRQILRLAAEGNVQEFALFSGPRLERIVSHDGIAFIGDSSHPMSGNFGSGAALALEDAYTLARTLDWAWKIQRPLRDALELFDSVRSPYYARLYKILDDFASIKALLRAERLPIDEDISERVKRISLASETWMYFYEIEKVVDASIQEAGKRLLAG